MKKSGKKASSVWFVLLLIFLAPGGFFILCGVLLLEPLRYIRLRRSRYHRDFPTRYKFPCETHSDSLPYCIVKEKGLPICYRRHPRNHELDGFFTYGNTLLNFSEPFIYDEEQGCWLTYYEYAEQHSEDTEPSAEDGVPYDLVSDTLYGLHCMYPEVHCEHVVWFIRSDKIKNAHARELLAQRNDVVLYTKKTLGTKLCEWVQNQN